MRQTAENATRPSPKIAGKPGEDSLHAGEMRPLPVHALTAGTTLEALVEVADHRRQSIDHHLACDVLEDHVALAAAREWSDERFELQRANHFAELRLALRRTHEIAAIDVASPEHSLVAR